MTTVPTDIDLKLSYENALRAFATLPPIHTQSWVFDNVDPKTIELLTPIYNFILGLYIQTSPIIKYLEEPLPNHTLRIAFICPGKRTKCSLPYPWLGFTRYQMVIIGSESDQKIDAKKYGSTAESFSGPEKRFCSYHYPVFDPAIVLRSLKSLLLEKAIEMRNRADALQNRAYDFNVIAPD